MLDEKTPLSEKEQQQPMKEGIERTTYKSSDSSSVEQSIQHRSKEEIIISWMQGLGTFAVSVAIALLTREQIKIAGETAKRELETAQDNRATDIRIAEGNRKKDAETAKDEQQHEIMSTYLEQMTNLLLERNLKDPQEPDEVRTVARSITLNAARRLDPERKGQMLKFLYEADLIGSCPPDTGLFSTEKCDTSSILKLDEATLQGTLFDIAIPLPGINLEDVDLSNAELNNISLVQAVMNGATMRRTKLNGAILNQAEMEGAELNRAELSGAFLINTNLSSADLAGAYLNKANLTNADLRCAGLQGAKLPDATIKGAKFKNATYDDDTEFPPNFDEKAQGVQKVRSGDKTGKIGCLIE